MQMHFRNGGSWIAVLAVLLAWSQPAWAVTPAQQSRIKELDAAVNTAGRLFKEKKFRESGKVVRDIQEKLDKLTAGAEKDLLEAVEDVYDRLRKAHALLELEGIPLPPLTNLTFESTLKVVAPTGKETVSFSSDIAPVLTEQCANCHGRERRMAGRLSVVTFSGLLKGGDNGAAIQPGKSANSLLTQKLKGAVKGERMPLQQPPLPLPAVAKFEKWIDEGAAFDGSDPNQDLTHLADLRKAQKMSAHDLTNERINLALKNWAAATGGSQSARAETRHFLLLGNVPLATLQKDGEVGDWLIAKIADMFGAPTGQSVVKGRITVFVFKDRADYAAFVKTIEKRDLPENTPGHWRYTALDAYAAIVPAPGDEYTLDALLAQHSASVYIASLGKAPHWFAEGSGRAAAARLKADDPRVVSWDKELPGLVSSMARPDDFATGKLPDEKAAIASYGFVKHLMSDSKRYLDLLEALRQGKEFAAAFSASQGGSLLQVAKDWASTAGK